MWGGFSTAVTSVWGYVSHFIPFGYGSQGPVQRPPEPEPAISGDWGLVYTGDDAIPEVLDITSLRDDFKASARPWSQEQLQAAVGQLASLNLPRHSFYVHEFEGHEVFARCRATRGVQLLDPARSQYIGEGGSAQVYRIWDATKGKWGPAYRQVRPFTREEYPGLDEEVNAHTILKTLNGDGSVPGIPKIKLVYRDSVAIGSIWRFYSLGNLTELNFDALSPEERVKGFWQLLKGLTRMFQMRVIQGDIHPKNIMGSRGSDKSVNFLFIDFAMSMQMRKIQQGLPLSDGLGYCHRPDFVTEEDYTAITTAWQEKDWATYWLRQHQREVYALSVSLFYLLNEDTIPHVFHGILGGMRTGPGYRPTAPEALQQVEEAIRKHYPGLAASLRLAPPKRS